MFFVLSKILSPLLDPAAILLALVVAGWLLIALRRKSPAGKIFVSIAAVYALAVAVLPIDAWLGQPLERRFSKPATLPANVDGIVVLGGAVDARATQERGQLALNGAAERLTAFLALARRYPEARLGYTGGSGSLADPEAREAAAVRPHLADLGLDSSRIVFENNSRNTYESAVMAADIAKPQPDQTWLLVTSALHMPRAVGSFEHAGWKTAAYPVDFLFSDTTPMFRFDLAGGLARLGAVLHEAAGLFFYRLAGMTEAFFPGPPRP